MTRFSESRAREIVGQLTVDIGHRVNGTAGYVEAADYLAAVLRSIRFAADAARRGPATHDLR